MAIGLATALRTSRMQLIADAVDAGSGAGKLQFYTAPRPATGGTATTLLAEITLNDPCGSVTDGVLTLDIDPLLQDTSANATGTCTWARLVTSDNAFVADLSVGTNSADIILNTTDFLIGGSLTVISGTINEGNA